MNEYQSSYSDNLDSIQSEDLKLSKLRREPNQVAWIEQ